MNLSLLQPTRAAGLGSPDHIDRMAACEYKFYSQFHFEGACMVVGAQRSVVGLAQEKACFRLTKFKPNPKPSFLVNKYGDTSRQSLGTITFKVPLGRELYLTLIKNVVDANIPLFIGLDILRRKKLLINYLSINLECDSLGFTVTLTTKLDHIFSEWPYSSLLYTHSELIRMPLHFLHPKAEKAFDLICR